MSSRPRTIGYAVKCFWNDEPDVHGAWRGPQHQAHDTQTKHDTRVLMMRDEAIMTAAKCPYARGDGRKVIRIIRRAPRVVQGPVGPVGPMGPPGECRCRCTARAAY